MFLLIVIDETIKEIQIHVAKTKWTFLDYMNNTLLERCFSLS